jgi:hypothetical protein
LNQLDEADGPKSSPSSQNLSPGGGPVLADFAGMAGSPILAVRHLQASGRTIPVFLSRNEGGSVAARCMFAAGDTPIIDGPTAEEVLRLVQDAIDGLLMVRPAQVAS